MLLGLRSRIGTATRWHMLGAVALTIPLCACGPRITASKDALVGRAVTVSNADTTTFTVERIVANDSAENSNCNDYPNKTLAPGDSYTTTFVICGPVHKLRVDTDKGMSFPELGGS